MFGGGAALNRCNASAYTQKCIKNNFQYLSLRFYDDLNEYEMEAEGKKYVSSSRRNS